MHFAVTPLHCDQFRHSLIAGSGGIYVLASKGPSLLRHPIHNFRMMPVVLDYGISIVWSFLYWVGMTLFVAMQGSPRRDGGLGAVLAQLVHGRHLCRPADGRRPGPADRRVVLQRRRQDPEVHRVRAVVHARLLDGQHLDHRRGSVPTVRNVWSRRDGGAWKSPERSNSLQGIREGDQGSGPCMTTKPAYVVHEVEEEDVTVDWFFGPGHLGTKVAQLALLLVDWFFAVLPVVITASSLLNRDDRRGLVGLPGGVRAVGRDDALPGGPSVVFVVGFLALHLVHRATAKDRNRRKTYDEQRLAPRLEIADAWYADKFGPEALRLQQRKVRIEPYGDLETYELRGLYRAHGVD